MAKAKEKKPKHKPEQVKPPSRHAVLWDLVRALHVKVDGLKVAQQRHEGADKVSFERAVQHLVTLGKELNAQIAGQKQAVAARVDQGTRNKEMANLRDRLEIVRQHEALAREEVKSSRKSAQEIYLDNALLRKQNAELVAEVTRMTGLWAHELGRKAEQKGKTR